MNKVLILTCNTGEGHNSAAYAVKTALTQKGISCELVDPVSFKSEKAKNLVSSFYNNLIKKTPSLFGAIYKLGDLYSSTSLPSPVYWANASYSEALQKYIEENQFDAVICTHLYGMEAMTAILSKTPSLVPCYGILTDYTCIPFMTDTKLDGYFVPHAGVKQYMVNRGFQEETIHISGIPVDARFSKCVDRISARSTLGIEQNKKVYLLMTGGIGCENMMGLCDELLSKLHGDSLIFVLTGRNEAMKSKLDEKYRANQQLRTVAFTKQVNLYMTAADVMLSKPGGLSSTEAAVVNVPLVHVHAIPGCETYNARFFSEHGMSLLAKNNKEAVQLAHFLTCNPESAEKMRTMQRKYSNPNAANDIVLEVCGI